MRVTAELYPAKDTRAVDLPEGASGIDLVRSLSLAPDAHLLVRGDVPIPIDEPLRDGERVRVISVVSGG
ncbi:MAG: hypothetical protein A3K65_04465 [Euryarchaeota archaeon RBG_16_68_12]|nr:MAG: hypothetical protein A3K65_04465 [Euryarchaeota archaeon RBG_16_68_12]